MLAYDKPYNEIRIEPAVIKESDTFTALVAKQMQRFICKKSWIIIKEPLYITHKITFALVQSHRLHFNEVAEFLVVEVRFIQIQ